MVKAQRLVWAMLAILSGWGGAVTAKSLRAPLIVISLDGFRADYFDRGLTPTLADLAATGVRAKAMRPAFPSVTEPNHYTLMTGLYPDHHGVIDNTMVDPRMPGMAFGGPHTKGQDSDPRWWDGATPLWVTAARAGLKTASSRWPGDEAIVHGVTPTYLAQHSAPLTIAAQVEGVLAWLDLPRAKRPVLIRLHLDDVDGYGHIFGPDSSRTNIAISSIDAVLGQLAQGLKTRKLYDRVNIVVVSDHGMTGVSPKRNIYLDDLVDPAFFTVPAYWAAAGVNPIAGHEAEVEKALLQFHDHMRCWRRQEIPARLHYGTNPRSPAIVCLADLGWSVVTHAIVKSFPPLYGNHGYDPAEPDMAALFIAHGPAFKSGVTLPNFDNVDIYQLLTTVMGLRPEPNDGRFEDVQGALK